MDEDDIRFLKESRLLSGFEVGYQIPNTKIERSYDAADFFWDLSPEERIRRAIADVYRELAILTQE